MCVSARDGQGARPRDNAPPHDLVDWRAQQKSFESLAGYSGQNVTLAGDTGYPERLRGLPG